MIQSFIQKCKEILKILNISIISYLLYFLLYFCSSIFREDHFQFGGTVKAYFCNNPIKVKKWEAGDDLRRVKRTASSRSEQTEAQRPLNIDFKRLPNDERFYLPKPHSNKAAAAEQRG